MSNPLFENAFRMDTRRSRGDFIKLIIILLLAVFVVGGILNVAGAMIIGEVFVTAQNSIALVITTMIFAGVAIAVSALTGVLLACAAFQRCNDIGISRLWVLALGAGYAYGFGGQNMVMIQNSAGNSPSWVIWAVAIISVPYLLFTLYLIFKPGQARSNAFGPNPLNMSGGAKNSSKRAVSKTDVMMTSVPTKAAKKKAAKKKAVKKKAGKKKAGRKAAKKRAKKAPR